MVSAAIFMNLDILTPCSTNVALASQYRGVCAEMRIANDQIYLIIPPQMSRAGVPPRVPGSIGVTAP